MNIPNKNCTLVVRNLTQLERSQQLDALILIKSLLNHRNPPCFHPTTVKELLLHPFFTINLKHARLLFNDDQFSNVDEELQKWYDSLSENEKSIRDKFDFDSFKDLKEIVSFFLFNVIDIN